MAKQTMGERSKELARSIFGGEEFQKAKPRVSTTWLREGLYYLLIQNVKLDSNRTKQVALFVEMTVVKVLDDAEGTGHRVGQAVTHAMWERFDSFLGNAKAFLSCVTGADPEEIGLPQVLEVVDDDQPLQGTVVEVQATGIFTKANKPFTQVDYLREVPATQLLDELDEEVQARYFPEDVLKEMAAIEAEAA